MKILMITSEAVPFAKTGGLADAVPALAAALKKKGHDVRLLMPRYYKIERDSLKKLSNPLGVPMGREELWCGVYKTKLPGTRVPVYMLDRENLCGRDGLYGPNGSSSWSDNSLRFALLSSASFQLCRSLKWIPDILHLHDWQSAPASCLLESMERNRGFSRTSSILTVHNLGYQGIYPSEDSGIFPTEGGHFSMDNLLHNGNLNFLSAGLNCTDEITTVSPTYAVEILSPEYSEGLGAILSYRKDRITGILNGMDYREWNPTRDPALKPHNYSIRRMSGKAKLKTRLQKEMGLTINPDIPLFGIITRLTGQKGVDLLTNIHGPVMELFRSGRAQLALLGTGESLYEDAFRTIGKTFPGNCGVQIAFSGPLSRLIEAGSDFFLMPSRYEPCGLNQMYSLRYGTLPLVRRTGGLADTVIDINADEEKGNGFVFENPTENELADAVNRAINFYHQKKPMSTTVKRAMKLRFDWKSSAEEYLKVYRKALNRRRTG
ncbi:MAG: glycogen synthase [Spirochaetaceae bacterium]|nr:glycogen synthase [Spirochaetaceae bacterium]